MNWITISTIIIWAFSIAACSGINRFPESAKITFDNKVPENEAEIYETQYKRYSRDQIAYLEQGDVEQVIRFYEEFLNKAPQDIESMFGMVVAQTVEGDLDEAMSWVNKSISLGMPVERYLAGPKKLLAPLYSHPVFQKLTRDISLLHGPSVFNIADSSVKIWLRTDGEQDIQIAFWAGNGRRVDSPSVKLTDLVQSNAEDDFTAVVPLEGLLPDRSYSYEVKLGDEWMVAPGDQDFWTLPKNGNPATFEIGFGGGAGFTPWYERMWRTIEDQSLDAFLLLGDNVYHDVPEHPETQRYMYYRRQSRPEYRSFAANTPLFAIWDDHDFGGNDSEGGPGTDDPPWKADVLDIFKENIVSPYYGGGDKAPGVWFDTYMGDVHFIFLDTRYYRSHDEQEEERTALGPEQKRWLKETLNNSTGTFRVIATSVPISIGTKGDPPDYHIDTWDGFKEEREEIWSFIEESKLDGVFFIAADRHRSDAWFNERSTGYGFYEFMSSRLTNVHTHPVIEKSIFGYNEKPSFGRLDFDTTAQDPTVTYTITNIDGEEVWSMVLKRSQLTLPCLCGR